MYFIIYASKITKSKLKTATYESFFVPSHFFLQIHKKRILTLLTFFTISSKPIGLKKRTLWQNKRLDLTNLIYFILHVNKMIKNRLNRAIYESQICLFTL